MIKDILSLNMLKARLNEIHLFLNHGFFNQQSATSQHQINETHATTRDQYQKRIKQHISRLHSADIAHILDGLPKQERLNLWHEIPTVNQGDILLALSDPVRESLIETMANDDLVIAAKNLDSDEIADLAELAQILPDAVVDQIIQSLTPEQQTQLEDALSFDEGTVGSLMDFSMITVNQKDSVASVISHLKDQAPLPPHSHYVFVTDRTTELKGVLPIQKLITLSGDTTIAQAMSRNFISFNIGDRALEAMHSFERYELSSAPVVDQSNKIIGRICVNDVMNFMRESTESEILKQMGLFANEDKFSGIWKGASNRWLWMAINLLLAFVATRIISVFEGTISQLLMLATLMPIVASTGGNIGNQACTLMIRALAYEQITANNIKKFYFKEIGISLINGCVWGGFMGILVGDIYQNAALGTIMFLAIIFNMSIAALVGVSVPLTRFRHHLDPAIGSHVVVTFFSDSFGFLIFLGMSALFLT